jgi:hypothetical protein
VLCGRKISLLHAQKSIDTRQPQKSLFFIDNQDFNDTNVSALAAVFIKM